MPAAVFAETNLVCRASSSRGWEVLTLPSVPSSMTAGAGVGGFCGLLVESVRM